MKLTLPSPGPAITFPRRPSVPLSWSTRSKAQPEGQQCPHSTSRGTGAPGGMRQRKWLSGVMREFTGHCLSTLHDSSFSFLFFCLIQLFNPQYLTQYSSYNRLLLNVCQISEKKQKEEYVGGNPDPNLHSFLLVTNDPR